jgi:mannose/cellobiose epimerase-like protein (N-acyl-D-glucosamine 2-epimerase family)
MRPTFIGAAEASQTPTFQEYIVQCVLPAWSNAAGGDILADPAGALRSPSLGVAATLIQQSALVDASARAAAGGLGTQAPTRFASWLSHILTRFLSPDGEPGFVRAIASARPVADATRGLEDHGWALRALASVHAATGSPELPLIADLVLDFVEGAMSCRDGGYCDDSAGNPVRRQAGHARLLDALLALHQSTGASRYLDRARGIVEFALLHFIDDKSNLVLEAFDRDWRLPAKGGGLVMRPSSTAEWIALLARFQSISPAREIERALERLGAALLRARDRDGLLVAAVDQNGAIVDPSRTLRGQLRLCAALAAIDPAGHGAHAAIARLENRIAAMFLKQAPIGCWCERVDARGVSTGHPVSMTTLSLLLEYFALAAAAVDAPGVSNRRAA